MCECRSQLTNPEVLVRYRNAPLTPPGRLLLCPRSAAGKPIAHTHTRRELPTVVRIAARLRRGEPLYEEA